MRRDFIRDETFNGTFPFKPHFKKINGFNMHYVDEGNGEPIVLLHGEPTWGYLYRKFITHFSNTNRVIVPDHMGFGKSDVPEDKRYVLKEHVDNLTKLLLELELENITLVMQDWGGPIGFGFATEHPDRIKRLVIMNTSVGVAKENRRLWFESMVENGTYEQLMGNMKLFIPQIMFGFFEKKISREEKKLLKKAYVAPFPNKKYCLGAKAFPLDIPKGKNHPSSEIMQKIRDRLNLLKDKQKILIWGMKDRIFPPKIINVWLKIYPNIEIHRINDASHFLQEDAPEEVISIITNFIKK
ncbi:MAG: alpha/beta fold hydrolase [Candidatus Lokiarchaeota archaeon]|nr:alpha/beta fold hydrolase [Candidatus Lokiarchaeota archaeon]